MGYRFCNSIMDLGMMRALAVLNVLKDSQLEGALQEIDFFLPYSAGQFIDENYQLSLDASESSNSSRRRIEIRLTRSSESMLHSKI